MSYVVIVCLYEFSLFDWRCKPLKPIKFPRFYFRVFVKKYAKMFCCMMPFV